MKRMWMIFNRQESKTLTAVLAVACLGLVACGDCPECDKSDATCGNDSCDASCPSCGDAGTCGDAGCETCGDAGCETCGDAGCETCGDAGCVACGDASCSTPDARIDDANVDDAAVADAGMEDAAPQFSERVESIRAAIDTNMYQCPEHVWPSLSYRDKQVLLLDMTQGLAYLWNSQAAPFDDRPTLTAVDFGTVPMELMSMVGYGYYQGVETLSVSLDFTQMIMDMEAAEGNPMPDDFAVTLCVHEGFHLMGPQAQWSNVSENPNSSYPVAVRPRYLRAQITESLKAAFVSGGAEHLPAAAYWYETWKTEFPDEYEATARWDFIEGSARFVEVLSLALANVGCAATPDQILAETKSLLDYYVKPGRVVTNAEAEAYSIGLVAGGLLREAGTFAGWEYKVAQGERPAEILLADVTAVAQNDDTDLLTTANETIAGENAFVGMFVDSVITSLDDSQYVRVPFSTLWFLGGFYAMGIYVLADLPHNPTAFLAVEGMYSADGTNTVELVGETFLEYEPNQILDPCGIVSAQGAFVIMPRDLIFDGATAGTFSASNGTVHFTDLPSTLQNDADGMPWLCPTL